jgi:hypothetical protein
MLVKLSSDGAITGNVNNVLVDISVGATGSEVVVASNLHADVQGGVTAEGYLFPVCIPAGTKISARVQTEFTSLNSIYVEVQLYEGGFPQVEGAGLDDIGTVTSGASALTTVIQGASGTKGSYTVLISSTARDYAGLLVAVHDAISTGILNVDSIDIAVGATGSEKIIIPDALYFVRSQMILSAVYVPYFIPIPAGTKISAAASSSNASPSTFRIGVYGIYQ